MEQRLKKDGNFTSPVHLIVNAYSEALLRVGTHTLALLVIVRWIIARTLTFSRNFLSKLRGESRRERFEQHRERACAIRVRAKI